MTSFELRPIGHVSSELTSRADAPRQGDEGAPDAALVLDETMRPGLDGVAVGDQLLVLTWLHEADRATLSVHPRGDAERPAQGVFSTRSPDRPNPIGVHRVHVLELDGATVRVSGLEAIDGTLVVDVKPVLGGIDER